MGVGAGKSHYSLSCRATRPGEGQPGRVAMSFDWQFVQCVRAPTSGTGRAGPIFAASIRLSTELLWPQRLHQQKIAKPASAISPSRAARRLSSDRLIDRSFSRPMRRCPPGPESSAYPARSRDLTIGETGRSVEQKKNN